ncbi:dihydroorotase family protein [Fodinicurvata sp. EGI_FJ10296]|uniref:dihydroorotase n=1 Tax=Fodinicurvata sp. EGI_FJ10296 TaxID=3231908 RepID=UPI0034545FE3
MTDFDLVVRGDLVLPQRIVKDGWVAVSQGRIAMVGDGPPPSATTVHDARGAWVMAGAIDAHVHSLSQRGQEGFGRSTRSAASGGVTAFCDMPYDDGRLIANVENFDAKRREIEAEAVIDVGLYATIHPSDGTANIADLARAGASAFKFSTYESDPGRFPRIPTALLAEAFAAAGAFGLVSGVHNENQEIVDACIAKARKDGLNSPEVHAATRPVLNEAMAMLEIYEAGVTAGARAHVVHCSISRGIEICESYKRQGHAASVEVLLPHLALTEDDDVRRLGGFGKINPPIRPAPERERLWRHLVAGQIDIVSSDHVCWSLDRKNNDNMLKNASGLPGVDAFMPLFLTACLRRDVPLSLATRLVSLNPARHFGFLPDKGLIATGYDADLVVIEPGSFKYDSGNTLSVLDWSPYDGMTMDVRVQATFVRGALVWDGSAIVQEPGFGRFIRPTSAPETRVSQQ